MKESLNGPHTPEADKLPNGFIEARELAYLLVDTGCEDELGLMWLVDVAARGNLHDNLIGKAIAILEIAQRELGNDQLSSDKGDWHVMEAISAYRNHYEELSHELGGELETIIQSYSDMLYASSELGDPVVGVDSVRSGDLIAYDLRLASGKRVDLLKADLAVDSTKLPQEYLNKIEDYLESLDSE